MPASFPVPAATLLAFLLVFCRVAGIFLLVPLPGFRVGPDLPRAALALTFTFALLPRWPAGISPDTTLSGFSVLIFSEFALGMAIGLAVSLFAEAFAMAAQLVSLQAGLSYASMIDPISQTESTTLLVLGQLAAGLLFFATGLDREVLRAVAASLESWPPGHFTVTGQLALQIGSAASVIFNTGLRLALPVIAVLVIVDLGFGLLSRMRSQMQVLSLLFAAKLLVSFVAFAAVVTVFPDLARELVARCLQLLARITMAG